MIPLPEPSILMIYWWAFVSLIVIAILFPKLWRFPEWNLCTSWYGFKLCIQGWWIRLWFKEPKAGVYNPREHIIPFIGPQVGFLRDSAGKWYGSCHMGFPIWEADFKKSGAHLEWITSYHKFAVSLWRDWDRKVYYVPWPGPAVQ